MRLKELKKQYRLLFAVVLVITMFVFCVIGLYDSYNGSQTNQRKNIYGGWHVAFLHTTQEAYEKISGHAIVNRVGKMEICGYVDSISGKKTYTVGYINDAIREMGGLKIEMGDYPKAENEIAIEAGALSALDVSYDVGDKIDFNYYTYDENGQKISHSEEFILTGIVRNYSDVWKNRNDSLIQFFVSPVYGEMQETQTLNCYIQVKEQYASNVSELKPLLGGKGILIENDYTYYEYADNSTWIGEFVREEVMFFMVILFAMLILVALIQNMINQKRESFVLIRSIGGERSYILKSLIKEVVPVLVSGILAGFLLGISIPALLFRILGLYWENLSFMIQQKHVLFALGGIILACFFSCLAGFIGVIRIPMCGGSKYQAIDKTGSGYKWSRRLSLLTTFCIGCVVISGCYSCYLSYYEYEYYKELYPYDYKYGYMPLYAEADSAIPAEVLEKVEDCYGVESVSAFRISPYYEVSWEGMEESEYVEKLPMLQSLHLPEEKKSLSNVYTCLYEVASTDERTFNEFAKQIDVGEITFEELKNSNKVIVYLPPLYEWDEETITATKDQVYWLQGERSSSYKEETIQETTILRITGEKGVVDVEVGAIICEENERENNRVCMPLTIIGSEKLGKSLNDIGNYTCIEIYGDKTNNQAQVEVELSKYSPEGIYFKSLRTERNILLIHFVLQLGVTGIISLIAITMLIIVKSGISDNYSTLDLKRNWLLYALGMQKRQIHGRIMMKEIFAAAISIVFVMIVVLFRPEFWEKGMYYINTLRTHFFSEWIHMLYNCIYVNQRISSVVVIGGVYVVIVSFIAHKLLNKKIF